MAKRQELGNKYYFLGFFAIIVMHILLISRLTFLPYPELFIYPYLTNIGLTPYAQIFDQHFPGLMFFPINLGTLGIVQPGNALLLHVGIIVLIHLLLIFSTFKLFKSLKASFLTSFIFLLWQPFLEGNTLWIDSFLPLLLIPSFYFLVKSEKNYKNILLSGILLGAALVMKQVVLPLIAVLFIFLLVNRESKR